MKHKWKLWEQKVPPRLFVEIITLDAPKWLKVSLLEELWLGDWERLVKRYR